MIPSSVAMLLSILIITFLVPLLVSHRTKRKTLENIVKAPVITYIAGGINLIFSTVAIIMLIRQEAEWPWIVFWMLFLLLGMYLTLYGLFWRITYDSSGFTYRTVYGKETTVDYSSITKIKVSKTVVHIYVNKNHFYVDNFAVGSSSFRRKLPKRLLKEGVKKPENTVKPPVIGHIVGGVVIVVFALGLTFGIWEVQEGIRPLDLKMIILAIGFILMAYMFLHDFFWSLTFDSSGFTYRTFYGKKTTIAYSSITKIKPERASFVIHANKKRFRVDYYAVNFDEFYKKLPQRFLKKRS